jgi:hypothetical protein
MARVQTVGDRRRVEISWIDNAGGISLQEMIGERKGTVPKNLHFAYCHDNQKKPA